VIGTSWRRLKLLFVRDRATRELEEEMELHRQLRSEALRHGHSNPVREAERRFGNPLRIAEKSRDNWGFGTADAFWQDTRYAARRLRQRPGFTASVVGILALGIGATTAMFSAVDAAMLRPLPFLRPNELVTLSHINIPFNPGGGREDREQSFDITTPMAMREVFSNVAAYASGGLNLADPGRPRRVVAGVVSGSFFETIGVRAARGRTIAPADGNADATKVVVLSWALWQGEFGGRDVIGTTIPLTNARYEIVGVTPEGFSFPSTSDLWIPMSIPTTPATFEPFRGYLPSTVIARLASTVRPELAELRLRNAWRRVLSTFLRSPGQKLGIDEFEKVLSDGALRPYGRRSCPIGERPGCSCNHVLLLIIACATSPTCCFRTARREHER
jgi:hypothetical protein